MMKCSAKAFAACPTRYLCLGDATFAEGSECDKFNQHIESANISNADRIRAMTDEELADMFCDATSGTVAALLEVFQIPIEPDEAVNFSSYKRHLTDWLQKPAKEGSDGYVLSGL